MPEKAGRDVAEEGDDRSHVEELEPQIHWRNQPFERECVLLPNGSALELRRDPPTGSRGRREEDELPWSSK